MGHLRASNTSIPSTKVESSYIEPPIRLTPSEETVLLWSSRGKTTPEIAIILGRSENTINFHFSNLRRKFSVSNRPALILQALKRGLIALP